MSLQIGLSIAPRMKQELKLTPQLQLSIRHLQLARADLIEEIQRELMSNPLLEERGVGNEGEGDAQSINGSNTHDAEMKSSIESSDERQSSESSGELNEGLDFDSIAQAAEARQDLDWDQYFEERRPRRELDPIRVSQEEYFSPEQHYAQSTTLSEHLLEQLHLSNFSQSEQEIAEEVIWNLDERGYLVGVSAEDLADTLEVDVELVEEVIESLLQFDPIGVGARDLRECLLAQCQAYNSSPLVIRLVTEHLEDIAHNRLPLVAKRLQIEVSTLEELLKEVRRFEPHPGRHFGGGSTSYVTPDVHIEWENGELKVRANHEGYPRLQINHKYRDQLRDTLKSSDHKRRKYREREEREEVSESRKYITERLSAAQALINSLQQRKQTIVLVTECIIEFQRDFFLYGPEHLKPLVLRQIAEKLDLHESTVSRATSHKFVHTPRGLYELKYFFHSKIQGNDGAEDLASQAVKIKIKNLITEEDPRKPLSDQVLTQMLADEGVLIARRTVAKYREALGILSSSKRRKYV